MKLLLEQEGFFANSFPIIQTEGENVRHIVLTSDLVEITNNFQFQFENTGIMIDGCIYTEKTTPLFAGKTRTLGDIMEKGDVSKEFFIPTEKLYYKDPEDRYSDETQGALTKEQRQTWQYIKGGKK